MAVVPRSGNVEFWCQFHNKEQNTTRCLAVTMTNENMTKGSEQLLGRQIEEKEEVVNRNLGFDTTYAFKALKSNEGKMGLQYTETNGRWQFPFTL